MYLYWYCTVGINALFVFKRGNKLNEILNGDAWQSIRLGINYRKRIRKRITFNEYSTLV